MKRTLKDYLFITLRGVAMGAADVVPGFLGGLLLSYQGFTKSL